jgi:phosphatidylserine/phosphatidylglycerophosphate/cardiolipin synthase-like enzyme
MTKKSSRQSESRSLISGIIAVIAVVIAVIVSTVSGVTNLNPTPTLPPVTGTEVANVPGNVTTISVGQGFGAQKGFWQVFFTAPTGSSNPRDYVNGIDTQLAAAINNTQRTLDIAAYEFNNPVLTQAVLDAHRRGVQVRMVTDNEDGIGDEETTINQFVDAGIQVRDDGRSALMHDKFMILDGTTVWTGSWNYTINDTYRNNNNALVLRSRQAVANYQAEFDEMFTQGRFGPRSPANTPNPMFTQDGVPIQMYFAAEDDVVTAITNALNSADTSIRFMTFSFTIDSITQVLLSKAAQGVQVQGIFETLGSERDDSELTPLFCAGLPVRQDGNPFRLHHKVFIVDDDTVITGSFNISANATNSNDENLVIIQDAALAAQYLAEFERRWAEAVTPDGLTCR